ncbi:MAG: hypothetical protein HYU43_05715 [Armatimonadetes bacterium]|nr:hypothetical protein [Armatimonadota bacterium]
MAGGEDGFAAELVGDNLYLKVVMDTKLRGRVDGEAVSYDGEERGYFRQVEQFLKAVETRDQRMVRTSYEDAVRTLAVTVAANRSLVTGRGERVEV